MKTAGILVLLAAISLGPVLAAVSAPSGAIQADKAMLIEKAKVKIALKQYDQAVRELNQARQLDANDSDIPNLMGLAYLRAGMMDAARSCFKRAIRLDPANARPYNNIGAIYHVKEQYKSAIKFYKKAIEKDPAFLLAYYNLGNAYFARKKYLQAIDTMHKIVQIDPDYLTRDHPGVELGVPDIDQAQRSFYYAKLYAQAGNVDKVVYFLQQSIELGFKNMKEVMEDKDFDPYRLDPRFQALVHR